MRSSTKPFFEKVTLYALWRNAGPRVCCLPGQWIKMKESKWTMGMNYSFKEAVNDSNLETHV